MSMNIFEQASREALRFSSAKGALSVEDLWHLPLTSARGVSLDGLAKEQNRLLKQAEEESFVTPKKTTKEDRVARLKLDVLKHIIAVKLEERDAAEKAQQRAEQRRALEEALEDTKLNELKSKTREELEAMLRELDS